MSKEIQDFLQKSPREWGRFQSEFNQEINTIYRELMLFEKKSLADGEEEKLYKMKNFFIENLREQFLFGDYIKWSLDKPYGYAGDYKIIDDIYLNSPKTLGFDRLFDNYFQMSAISVAVRNRKEDFKRFIIEHRKENRGKNFCILDIASGPCRDIKELLHDDQVGMFRNACVTCLDADDHSIAYAKELLQNDPRVNWVQMNIIRLALSKNPEKLFPGKFDVIYSTGLFDYLDDKVSTRLIHNLRKLLNPGGLIAISDVRDKFSNPSVYFMEWVAEWNLIYRSDDDFRQIFLNAGFEISEQTYGFEQQGILQYIVAVKSI